MPHPAPEPALKNTSSQARAFLSALPLPAGTALAATGSLAREEMAPHSDVDLILIHADDTNAPPEVEVESLWSAVRARGYRLDHAVRTPGENAAIVTTDITAALALLDLSFLSGEKWLVTASRQRVLQRWRGYLARDIEPLVSTAIRRWRRSGSVVTMTRPDIKNGRGGLRDMELLDGLALGNLTDRPDISAQRALMLNIRSQLHERTRRARDILDPEFAADIAEDLGFADRYALSRELAACARVVDDALTSALSRARSLQTRSSTRPTRIPLDVDVVSDGHYVVLSRSPNLDDVGLPLRVCTAAARSGLEIHPETWEKLRDVPKPTARLPRSVAAEFLTLLTFPTHSPRLIEALDAHGLWEGFVPEWPGIRGLMPREPVHVHTIDRHLLDTVSWCADSAVSVARPDLLLLAALYHDIGKGHTRPHASLGAELVARQSARLGLPLRDRACVQTLVAEHTLMARIAARMDPTSDGAVDMLLDAVGHDLLTVELLGALTEADARATAPKVFNPQLRHARDVLVRQARRRLNERVPTRPMVSAPGPVGLRAPRSGAGDRAVAYCRGSHAEVLTRMLAVIAAKRWSIDEARIARDIRGDIVAECVVRSTMSRQFGHLDDDSDIAQSFVQAFNSRVYTLVPGSAPGAESTNGVSSCYWRGDIVEIRCADRIGALAALHTALPEYEWLSMNNLGGTLITHAKIAVSPGAAGAGRAAVERSVNSALAAGLHAPSAP